MTAPLHARLRAVRRRYVEPHRAHHGVAHLSEVLVALRGLRADLADPGAAWLAAYYHDAIYDPRRTDNEAASAALLRAELAHLIGPERLDRAAALVLATATHRVPEGLDAASARDCALFLDADMAVLGGDATRYARYAAGIAAEYEPVHGRAAYRRGRADFLRRSLARERLFLTDRFHARLDARARTNLRRELASLEEL